ncbi:MAG: adenosylmethionine decarboxylase [Thermoplasmata archaeon]
MVVGIHIILDFYGVDEEILNYVESMKPIFENTAKEAKLTKISSDYYQFRPKGCSGIILLAESHLSFHTWPEYKLVTLDIFTCGDQKQAYSAFYILEKYLKPTKVSQCIIERGTDAPEKTYPEISTEEIKISDLN